MFIAGNTEPRCSTCHHWIGWRVAEENYVYSLSELEGHCCRDADETGKQGVDRLNLAENKLTLPSLICENWRQWPEAIATAAVQGEMANPGLIQP